MTQEDREKLIGQRVAIWSENRKCTACHNVLLATKNSFANSLHRSKNSFKNPSPVQPLT